MNKLDLEITSKAFSDIENIEHISRDLLKTIKLSVFNKT